VLDPGDIGHVAGLTLRSFLRNVAQPPEMIGDYAGTVGRTRGSRGAYEARPGKVFVIDDKNGTFFKQE
jgi:hypothetical protein